MAIRHETPRYPSGYNLVGVYDIIEWIPTEWSGPRKPGKYLTADGKGNTKFLYTTGDTDRMKELLFERFEDVLWDGGIRLTDSEMVRLARNGFQTWYTIEPDYSYGEYNGDILVIFRKENIPKYWLKGHSIIGPIDDELDTCPVHRTERVRGVSRERSERYDENGHDTYKDISLF